MAGRTTYSDKLKDPRWQKKRLECLEASEWACEECGSTTDTLHVHLHQYIRGREPWEYSIDELGVLCEDCHDRIHQAKAEIDDLLANASACFLAEAVGYLRAMYAREAGLSFMVCDYEAAEAAVKCFADKIPQIRRAVYAVIDVAEVGDSLDEAVIVQALNEATGAPT